MSVFINSLLVPESVSEVAVGDRVFLRAMEFYDPQNDGVAIKEFITTMNEIRAVMLKAERNRTSVPVNHIGGIANKYTENHRDHTFFPKSKFKNLEVQADESTVSLRLITVPDSTPELFDTTTHIAIGAYGNEGLFLTSIQEKMFVVPANISTGAFSTPIAVEDLEEAAAGIAWAGEASRRLIVLGYL